MTKKDYIRAAAMIRQYGDKNTRELLCDFMINFFKSEPGRFDEARFEEACEYIPLKDRKG